jgi:undecaprenyl-diphosphatase
LRPALAPRASYGGPSFPSGHTTAAAACLLAFALVATYGAEPKVRRLSAAVAVGLAVAVACSRVLLGVHWASDVLAGLAIGWTWYAVCALMFGGRLLRFGLPARVAERGLTRASSSSPPPTTSPTPTAERSTSA